VKPRPLKIDLHVHTHYSEDASTSLEQLEYYSKKKGLDGIAVTDHETLKGALEFARKSQLVVIPGLEVETQSGHVLALNITTLIPPKLAISETIDRIHEAGGIAVIAHPTAVLKTGMGQMVSLGSNLDAVEVINSAAFPFFLSTYLGRRLATRLKLPQTAGSDAHHPPEIGNAYTLVGSDPDPDDVVKAIIKGEVTPCGKSISWSKRIKRGAFGLARRWGFGRRYSSKPSI